MQLGPPRVHKEAECLVLRTRHLAFYLLHGVQKGCLATWILPALNKCGSRWADNGAELERSSFLSFFAGLRGNKERKANQVKETQSEALCRKNTWSRAEHPTQKQNKTKTKNTKKTKTKRNRRMVENTPEPSIPRRKAGGWWRMVQSPASHAWLINASGEEFKGCNHHQHRG